MWINCLSRCLVILLALELQSSTVAWDWEKFKAKSGYIDHESLITFQTNGTRKAAQGWDRVRKLAVLEKLEPGFEFDDEEMARLKLWPAGNIPFYIDKVSYDKVFRDKLRLFLENVNTAGGVRFMELHSPPTDGNARWIFFINRRGILDTEDYTTKSFTNKGPQKVVLGYNCFIKEHLYPVVLAIVGVPPQHTAPNRDQHIKVNKENILSEKQHLFDVLSDKEWLFHDLDYDFESAGHFDFHKHTRNGFATIKPKTVDATAISNVGHAQELSFLDILKIRMLYNFISRSPSEISDTDCKKYLTSSSKISRQQAVKPRNKPNKYLGLPDNEEKATIDKLFDENQVKTNLRNKDDDKGLEEIKSQVKVNAEEKDEVNIEEKINKDNATNITADLNIEQLLVTSKVKFTKRIFVRNKLH